MTENEFSLMMTMLISHATLKKFSHYQKKNFFEKILSACEIVEKKNQENNFNKNLSKKKKLT